jgi:hypothetical protein
LTHYQKFTEVDFALWARAFNRARALHRFYLPAGGLLPDHGHGIGSPVYPVTISLAIYNEDAGMSADEQNERCGLVVERWRMPSDPRARI